MSFTCFEVSAIVESKPLLNFSSGALNAPLFITSDSNYTSSDSIEEKEFIHTLINFKYSLKQPIIVNFKREKFEYIGDIPELKLYSYGKNKFEVLRELNEELTELFEKLLSMDDSKLGKYPKIWKSILKEYISNED
ncbi:MAG: hypothetical protein A2Y33_07375 [Spirochaetes bacterium GWF1_51_8]|nr:MAG: hypothetical protein A2Y33_07375 [Spirochaetes bacterium GWF1_51_8]